MNTRTWPIRVVVAGLALLLVGPILISFAPTQTVWTSADEATLRKASNDFHASTFQLPQHKTAKNTPPAYDPVAAKSKYEAAKAAYDKQAARFESASARPAWLRWILRIAGILVTALGIYGHFTAEPSAPAAKKDSPAAAFVSRSRLPAPEPESVSKPEPEAEPKIEIEAQEVSRTIPADHTLPSPLPPPLLPPGYNDLVTRDGPPPKISEQS